MEGFITIDTLYLNLKYPYRDIFDFYYRFVKDVDTRRLKEGIVVGDFVVKTGSSGYKISVWKNDARIFLTEQVDEKCGEGKGMGIWVQLGPKFLIQHITEIQSAVNDLLYSMGIYDEYPLTITRMDLAIDLLGISMKDQDIDLWKTGWVGRSKLSKVFYNSRTGILESIYFGSRKSPIYLRVYDKVAQSIIDGDYMYWRDIWKDYAGPVTRVEWEIKPKEANFKEDQIIFDCLNETTIREMLNYLLTWGHLAKPNYLDSNRHRWKDTQFWSDLKTVVNNWSNGIYWPTSRYGKEFHGISPGYIKFLVGTIASGMARISEDNPSFECFFEGLRPFGEDIFTIKTKAQQKAELIKRL